MIARSPGRVLMTVSPLGGVWSYALDLARALRPLGTEVVLATMGGRLDRARRIEVNRLHLEVHESSWALEWMPDPWVEVDRAGEWLLAVAGAVKPDLVHLNGFCHAALPWGVPVVVAAHTCAFARWHAVRGEDPPASWDEHRRRARAGLVAADMVVAPSAAMLAALGQAHGFLPRAQVVWNGRRADRASMAPVLKEELVLSAGRPWDEAENLAALDRAATRLAWPVAVAGEVRHPAGGEPVRAPHVSLLGQLGSDAMARWMARAAVYAAPVRHAPFGLGPLEAGAAGCALVLGDIPSLREVWEGAAVFVPPDDAEGLARALNRLIEEPSRRASLAVEARERAVIFEPARMARGYRQVYIAALADSRVEVAAQVFA